MTDEKVKLSQLETEALRMLAECEPKKGVPLPEGLRRTGARLIRRGLAWSVGFGNFSVFIITDAGRAALRGQEQ